MRVAVVGPLPPPSNGFANVTKYFAEMLKLEAHVELYNRASHPSGIFGQLMLLCRFAKLQMSRVTRSRCTYIAVSGGRGQLLDSVFTAVAAYTNQAVVFHHHSFAYLDRPSKIARLLFTCAPAAVHVCLCEAMGERLAQVYKIDASRIQVVSNAAFLKDLGVTAPLRSSKSEIVVGYFSAVTATKGIDVYLDILRSEALCGLLRAKVAGPMDPENGHYVNLLKQAGIEYVGELQGTEKTDFLSSLDVLLFPSNYRNEAEPVAVLEAMQRGVAVISTRRGCLQGMLNSVGAAVEMAEYKAAVVRLLLEWSKSPDVLIHSQQLTRAAFEARRSEASEKLTALLKWMARL